MSIVGDLLKVSTIPQRIMLGGAAVALVAATGYNVVQAIDNRHLSKQVTQLDGRINDPRTGYVVRLSQAETNTAACTTAVGRQTAAIKAQGQRDAATLAASQARYDREHTARVKAENSAATILAHKPQGATVADRVADVDAQILGDLK